ncbi:hypothetical protein HDU76_002608 [Blyttiomyces sp. JEL0837]|nr:hypothetical protein HDU76_002608 [Blyttiomyces sp. JEL0837]
MSGLFDMLIGKRLTPEEQVKKWRQSIRQQERELEKQIRGIETEEAKVKKNIKAAAKRKDMASCKLLAKEVVRSRKAKDRIHTSKAQLNSLGMQLQQQLAAAKVAGTLKKSTDIMKLVNNLIKLPEIHKTMQEMSMEMSKAGIIGEMMEDAIEGLDEEGIEEEAEEEVEKVLSELTDGLLLQGGSVGAPLETKQEEAVEEEPELDAMQARLAALRNITALLNHTILIVMQCSRLSQLGRPMSASSRPFLASASSSLSTFNASTTKSLWTSTSTPLSSVSRVRSPSNPQAVSHIQQSAWNSGIAAAPGGAGGWQRFRKRRKFLIPEHPVLGSAPSAEEAVNNILYNTPPLAPSPVTRHILNCLVSNEPGVLSRVSGILAGRGFNIDSLVVAKTEVPDLSRMTVVLRGQATTIEQARRQLEDLVPVWAVLDYTHTRIVERELLLVKVSALPHEHFEDTDVAVEVEGYEDVEREYQSHNHTVMSPLLTAGVHRHAITELARLFKAHVVDVTYDTLVLELSARPDKIDAFLKLLKPYGIIEATRSGSMAMPRSPVEGLYGDEVTEPVEEEAAAIDVTQLPPG